MSERSVVGELLRDVCLGAIVGLGGAALYGVIEAATNTATGLFLPLRLWMFAVVVYAVIGLFAGIGLGFAAWVWRRIPFLPEAAAGPLIGAMFLGGLFLVLIGIPLNERALPDLISARGLIGNAVFLLVCGGLTLLFYFFLNSRRGPHWVPSFVNLAVWLSVLLAVGDHIDTFGEPIGFSVKGLATFVFLLFVCIALALTVVWALRAIASDSTSRTVPGVALAVIVLVALGLVFRVHDLGSSASAPPPGKKPNVLWLVMDTTRADHLSVYGYKRPTSPTLEKIAKDGVVFEDAYSESSWTIPGHFVMVTGRFDAAREKILSPEYQTAAEIFRENGYETGAVLANMSLGRGSGFDQGFDTTVDGPVRIFYLQAFEKVPALRYLIRLGVAPPDSILRLLDRQTFLQNEAVRAKEINAHAIDWIDERDPERPFFLFINYLDPHDAYDPPEEFREKLAAKADPENGFIRYSQKKGKTISSNAFVRDVAPKLETEAWQEMLDLYDAEVAYLDDQIGKLLAALEKRGILEDTIVVITADHGELFGEHGLANHFKALSDEETHIPLLMRYPARLKAGTRVESPAQLRDILPTLVELTEVKSETPMDGRTLVAAVASGSDDRDETVGFLYRPVDKEYPFTAPGHLLGVRTDDKKYVWSSTGQHEFYDLASDPDAQKNLHGQHPDESAMADRLARWKKEAGFENFGEKQQAVDRLMKDKLKALGYAN